MPSRSSQLPEQNASILAFKEQSDRFTFYTLYLVTVCWSETRTHQPSPIMRHFLTLLAVGELLQCAIALPQAQQSNPTDANYEEEVEAENNGLPPPPPLTTAGKTSTSITTTATSANPSGYGDNYVTQANTCVLFLPPDNSYEYMCRNVCGDAVRKQEQANHAASVSCISNQPFTLQEGTYIHDGRIFKRVGYADSFYQAKEWHPAIARVTSLCWMNLRTIL